MEIMGGGADIYPNYQKLRAVKEECYPHNEAIVNSDSVAEVKLQALLDHTFSQLLKAQEYVIAILSEDDCHKLQKFFNCFYQQELNKNI
jgi:hypothetical protein